MSASALETWPSTSTCQLTAALPGPDSSRPDRCCAAESQRQSGRGICRRQAAINPANHLFFRLYLIASFSLVDTSSLGCALQQEASQAAQARQLLAAVAGGGGSFQQQQQLQQLGGVQGQQQRLGSDTLAAPSVDAWMAGQRQVRTQCCFMHLVCFVAVTDKHCDCAQVLVARMSTAAATGVASWHATDVDTFYSASQ